MARPDDEVFERWKYVTPNFSLRMGNLAGGVAGRNSATVLRERCQRWNQRYQWLANALQGIAGLRLPQRPAKEQFVASSMQFSLWTCPQRTSPLVAACAARGVFIKWFGARSQGFHQRLATLALFRPAAALPNAERVLGSLCDMRLPLTLTQADCLAIAKIVRESITSARSCAPA